MNNQTVMKKIEKYEYIVICIQDEQKEEVLNLPDKTTILWVYCFTPINAPGQRYIFQFPQCTVNVVFLLPDTTPDTQLTLFYTDLVLLLMHS